MSTPRQTVLLVLFFVAVAALPLLGMPNLIERAVQVLILALFALSLNVLVGHLGNISFGHAAFFAIGGYTCVYCQTRLGWPLPLSFGAALGLGTVSALVIGFFCVRLNDIYFAMLTLAFSMLVWAIAFKWKSVTGGDDGFVGATIPPFIGTPLSFFWFTYAVVAVSTAALWALSNSTMGRTFIAIRENATRAAFVGINVKLMRIVAFVIAGLFGAISGALMSLYLRGMFPEAAFWGQSGRVMIVVLLGGMHFFVGPIIGAVTFYLLEVTIAQHTLYWSFYLGLILLVLVLVAPEGLTALVSRLRVRASRNVPGSA